MFTLTPSDYTDIYRNLDYMDKMTRAMIMSI
jgi:hypothetical protein